MRKNAMAILGVLAVGGIGLVGCGGSTTSAVDPGSPAVSSSAEPSAPAQSDSPAPATSAACSPAHPNVTTIEQGTLTVAAYEYPPFSLIKGDQISGAEGEILNEIAKLECLSVKVQPGAAAAMIPSIEAGRADTTLGSWYRTAAREKVVRLSDPVIIDQLTLISKSGVDSIEGLVGKKVGSTLGFLWNDDLKALVGGDLKLFDNTQALYADLASGRIEVVVDTYPSGQAALKNTPIDGAQFKVPAPDKRVVSTTKPGQTNFPTNLTNESLQQAINEDLTTLRDKGTLAEIAAKWGFAPSAVEKTEPNLL